MTNFCEKHNERYSIGSMCVSCVSEAYETILKPDQKSTLKTAQEKVQEEVRTYQGMVPATILDTLVATIYTDLLDSIEKGMGGEEHLSDAEVHIHRKFLSVIKEHRN